jgi:hypothetical protein
LRYTIGAGSRDSGPRRDRDALEARAVRTSAGMSLPIICATIGRPVGFSSIERRMNLLRLRVAMHPEVFRVVNVAPP